MTIWYQYYVSSIIIIRGCLLPSKSVEVTGCLLPRFRSVEVEVAFYRAFQPVEVEVEVAYYHTPPEKKRRAKNGNFVVNQ